MAYAKPIRTVRISLADAGEADLWIEVEHPETLSWRTKRRIIGAQSEQDEATRSVRQAVAMVVRHNLTDDGGTLTDEALDNMPSHVVEGVLVAIGGLFDVPKSTESGSSTG